MKACVGQILSRSPGGRTLHYWMQRYVTRSLPFSVEDFQIRADAALRHLAFYRSLCDSQALGRSTFVEFGAGWDLTIPLVYRSCGVFRQFIFDTERLARPELVGISLDRVRTMAETTNEMLSAERLPSTKPESHSTLGGWLEGAGVHYVAPGDARATGLPDGCVDCVTNTATLEHIPVESLRSIFKEMFRIIRPGGMMSCQIDLSDHFSHADPSLDPWHFLRYSERLWKFFNSELLYQNRLRASAYVELAKAVGFEVARAETELPQVNDKVLAAPVVHPEFAHAQDDPDFLAATMDLLCVKPTGKAGGRASRAHTNGSHSELD